MKVFYVPGTDEFISQIIDCVIEKDGREIGMHSGQTLEQLRVEYPTIEIGEARDVAHEREERMRSKPTEITEEAYLDALETMPPNDWVVLGRDESFKFIEHLIGEITSIYAKVDGKWWTFSDRCTLTHAQIIERIKAEGVTA